MNHSGPCFLLVDDHALFRTGLGIMLSEYWPLAVMRHAGQWAQALDMVRDMQPAPDLVMLDIQLPDGDGLDNLAQLQSLLPGCPILLMSAQVDAERLAQAQQRGAAGLVAKVASAAEIVAAVHLALSSRGSFAVTSSVARPEPVRVSGGGAVSVALTGVIDRVEPVGALSARQLAILSYLGRGTPNKAIARQLGLSENEVRAEVSGLTERLNATSRQEAYTEALARGWVTP
ncbi:MAG: response regulator transcription factor [Aquabacterium sp.]|jgi:DNA-binding NarL/FixJ family response regulator|uniref:response regulator transcription factor n=1 Tax=Aquabacterium sp. TaxID=1872578 RepID=UPI001B6284E3|nr:response regulator transcription factor [Aquabacterium sp.]MBP7132023.1 response regulator transcription factor [Aquabacterium sp.]MBP8190525.1 response regulator transcription factor [Aquabacterium sp.]MBP9062158.1 response regulator transcription factor [Aquabacterium sp.]MDQ5927019.1 two-component system, NarL family, nitrate/nitrite response regulator NarL [Pseudomonadota bacterium]